HAPRAPAPRPRPPVRRRLARARPAAAGGRDQAADPRGDPGRAAGRRLHGRVHRRLDGPRVSADPPDVSVRVDLTGGAGAGDRQERRGNEGYVGAVDREVAPLTGLRSARSPRTSASSSYVRWKWTVGSAPGA